MRFVVSVRSVRLVVSTSCCGHGFVAFLTLVSWELRLHLGALLTLAA